MDDRTGFVIWPDGWPNYHNGQLNVTCDMLVGPCACGAWHQENEFDYESGVLYRRMATGDIEDVSRDCW